MYKLTLRTSLFLTFLAHTTDQLIPKIVLKHKEYQINAPEIYIQQSPVLQAITRLYAYGKNTQHWKQPLPSENSIFDITELHLNNPQKSIPLFLSPATEADEKSTKKIFKTFAGVAGDYVKLTDFFLTPCNKHYMPYHIRDQIREKVTGMSSTFELEKSLMTHAEIEFKKLLKKSDLFIYTYLKNKPEIIQTNNVSQNRSTRLNLPTIDRYTYEHDKPCKITFKKNALTKTVKLKPFDNGLVHYVTTTDIITFYKINLITDIITPHNINPYGPYAIDTTLQLPTPEGSLCIAINRICHPLIRSLYHCDYHIICCTDSGSFSTKYRISCDVTSKTQVLFDPTARTIHLDNICLKFQESHLTIEELAVLWLCHKSQKIPLELPKDSWVYTTYNSSNTLQSLPLLTPYFTQKSSCIIN